MRRSFELMIDRFCSLETVNNRITGKTQELFSKLSFSHAVVPLCFVSQVYQAQTVHRILFWGMAIYHAVHVDSVLSSSLASGI